MIQEKNGFYIVRDVTQGPYLNRVEGNASFIWVTIWTKDLKLVEFTKDNYENMLEALENKEDWHYNRAVRTKNRHLKELKEYLGISEPVLKKNTKKKIIFYDITLFGDKVIRIEELRETERMFGTYKKAALRYTEYTEEKAKIAEEFNRKQAEFNKYKKEVLDILFN